MRLLQAPPLTTGPVFGGEQRANRQWLICFHKGLGSCSDDTVNNLETVDGIRVWLAFRLFKGREEWRRILLTQSIFNKKVSGVFSPLCLRASGVLLAYWVSQVKSSQSCRNTLTFSFRNQSVSTYSSWRIRKQQEAVAGCRIMYVNRRDVGVMTHFLLTGKLDHGWQPVCWASYRKHTQLRR